MSEGVARRPRLALALYLSAFSAWNTRRVHWFLKMNNEGWTGFVNNEGVIFRGEIDE